MNRFNSFSNFTRKLIVVTSAFLFYGYFCRLVELYFFWESKTIGWVLFWVSIIFISSEIVQHKKLQNEKVLLEKICIGLSIFIISMKCIFFFVIQQTTAFNSAVNFIKSNQAIQNKVGNVNDIFFMPIGGISMTTDSKGSTGAADLNFVVKGSRKHMDLNVLMNKDFDTDWQIMIKK